MNIKNTDNRTLRVLYLEDAEYDVEIVREKLHDSPFLFDLDWVSDKEKFLQALKSCEYDAVLVDYKLLDYDAPTALSMTKTICPETPFLCISGAVSAETAIELLKEGAVDYILKDRIERLPYAIRRAVDEIEEKQKKSAAEDARDYLQRELENKVNELEEVVFVASHDLRTPLVTIKGFSAILDESIEEITSLLQEGGDATEITSRMDPLLENLRRSAEYISQSASNMESLVRGLLDISRLYQVELKKDEIDMNRLIQEVLENYRYITEQGGGDIHLSVLPSCVGAEGHIRQIFHNLVDNAFKYASPDRPCVINITGRKEQDRSVYCVEDNGQGIPVEYHKKIFEVFHQLDPSCKGDGLGLNIVRKIVEKHAGKVWVESELDHGSKFFISI